MAIKLGHGVRNGKIVRIREVNNGLSCGCVCPNPECGVRLVAVQGNEIAWHFRHYVEDHHNKTEYECIGAAETTIHLLAKDILAEKLEQILPARRMLVRRHNFDEIKREHKKFRDLVVQEQTIVVFDEIHSENDYSVLVNTDDSFVKPDVIAVKGGVEIYFEIRVTHAVNDAKREKIKKLGKSCIEINLSHVDRNIDIDALTKEVHDLKNRKWICHRKDNDFLRKAKATEEKKGQYYRQKRAEEKKKNDELARIKREQEERDINSANYKKFETDFFDELLPKTYSWKRGFADERIQRFIKLEEIESENSTVLNRYDPDASVEWHSEDEDGIDWEINFCGQTFYVISSCSNDNLKCIHEALFDFLRSLLTQDIIEGINLRETEIRQEEERRKIEFEAYQKKLARVGRVRRVSTRLDIVTGLHAP